MRSAFSTLVFCAFAFVGCPRSGPETARSPRPANVASVDIDLDATVERLNRHCQAAADCASAAGIVDGEVSAETKRLLESTRAELEPHGHDVAYFGTGFVVRAVSDLHMIVGGQFSADHLGPTEVAAIRQRVLLQPDLYLETFETRFVPAGQMVSHSHDAVFLEMVFSAAPDRALRIAQTLIEECDDALSEPPAVDDLEGWTARVEGRRDALLRFRSRR